jgi:hypothetical protein
VFIEGKAPNHDTAGLQTDSILNYSFESTIPIRIREGDKLDIIQVQILTPRVRSGSAKTAPSHIAHE